MICGTYLGDNDGTCPTLVCIRPKGHRGLCDNTSAKEDAPSGESSIMSNEGAATMTQPTTWAMEKAAQLWCKPGLENRQMDPELALAIAAELDALRAVPSEARIAYNEVVNANLMASMETAWGIIANAHGGDWSKAAPEWKRAAERWRDEDWHVALDALK